jgi:hypothetical protein
MGSTVNSQVTRKYIEIFARIFFTLFWHKGRMEQAESSRSSDRKRLDLLVKGRSRSRPIFVEVIDVSEGGCKVKGGHGFARVGESILLRIDGVHTPVGKFVWVDGRYAGIAFEGKMHPAVVDFLHTENAKKKEQKKAGNAA